MRIKAPNKQIDILNFSYIYSRLTLKNLESVLRKIEKIRGFHPKILPYSFPKNSLHYQLKLRYPQEPELKDFKTIPLVKRTR